MGKLINLQELKRQYEAEPARCVQQLLENMETGKLKPDNFSFRDLFVALHPDGRGRELLYECSFARHGGSATALREAADFVSTGDFSNITGQIIYNKVREGYRQPKMLWPQLSTTVKTEFLNGERIPGVTGVGSSQIEKIEEGAKYPLIGVSENWIDTKPTVKHGAEIDFSRESIVADRTGIMLKQAGDIGKAADIVIEKEIISLATGQTNNYNRNGVYLNTYLTAGAYVNSLTGNALDGSANEWRALEKNDLLFDAMVSPDTGEPIGIPDKPQLLVPSGLLATAERIVSATNIQTVDMRAMASTIRTDSPNPLGSRRPQILSNQYVKAVTGSATQWFYGDFAEAIYWMEVWGIETLQAADNNESMFTRDIWARHRVSYRGVGQVVEPRFMVKSDL